MAAKLQPIISPQVKKIEERILKSIEEIMKEYLEASSSMQIKDKKIIIKKIVRLSSGL
jgi:hypothetical protein